MGVLLLGSLLTLVVLFVLGRNVVKIYLERSRGVPGSRYRTKVISLIAGLILLPSLLLFSIASGLLRAAVDQWFEPEVESVLNDGKGLLDLYEADEAARGLRQARQVAGEVASKGLLQTRSRKSLLALLDDRRETFSLAGVRVYDGNARLLGETYEGNRGDVLRGVHVPESALRDLAAGERESIRHSPERAGELLLFLGVPMSTASRRRPGARWWW